MVQQRGSTLVLDRTVLEQMCHGAGADDVAFTALDHPNLAGQRDNILQVLP